jgi:hypothetical protein
LPTALYAANNSACIKYSSKGAFLGANSVPSAIELALDISENTNNSASATVQ